MHELREFGKLADAGGFPSMHTSGTIRLPTVSQQEVLNEGKRREEAEEAGSSAGSWQGPWREAASTREASPAERSLVGAVLGLTELVEHYPETGVLHSSNPRIILVVPARIFSSINYPVHFLVESDIASWRAHHYRRSGVFVPDVRAWAFAEPGFLIRSHHQYPDGSICAHMPGQWIATRDALVDLIDWYVCWVAKTLYSARLGRWPGPQHCSSFTRVVRDRPEEFCGCGHDLRYADCCRARDLEGTLYDHFHEECRVRKLYLQEVEGRGLECFPPIHWPRSRIKESFT